MIGKVAVECQIQLKAVVVFAGWLDGNLQTERCRGLCWRGCRHPAAVRQGSDNGRELDRAGCHVN